MKAAALRLYRLGALVLIAWMVREHHVWLRIEGDAPIALAEVSSFLPDAALLQPDDSNRAGVHVLNSTGSRIGYVVRTMPQCKNVIGYCGTTDTLIAFDNELRVVGVKIRSSQDTGTHVDDIVHDRHHFLDTWNGMKWDKIAKLDLDKAGIEGVSGATRTSMAIAEGITQRLKMANEQFVAKPKLRIRARDIGLALVVIAACVMAFTHLHGRRWMRRVFQVIVIAYVGFYNGDLIAQSLLVGWAKSGVPWHAVPGLTLMIAAALLVPWAAKKPLYCQHICPHGAAQELLGRIAPHRLRIHLPRSVADGLRWLPPLLLVLVVVVTMMAWPFDLAGIEPFDAYIIRSAGSATIIVAIIGLLASLCVPMAYCKYGCPTGALLEFVRYRGHEDRFGKRDVIAGLLVLLVALLSWKYTAIYALFFPTS